MDKIKAMSENAYNYLMKQQNPKQWCRAYFLNHSTCEAVENNMCETFNNCIIEARGKPLIYMLEGIRLYVMKRMQQRKALVNGWGDKFAPKIRERIEIAKVNSRFWICHYNGDNRFEVRHINGIDAYVVDTNARTCACREWDLTGIPCCHAVTTIIYNSTIPDDYVHSCYYVETIKKAYAYSMNPLNGPNLWRKTNIEGMEKLLPPLDRRMPGRPKKNRRKDPHESPSKPSHLSRKGTQMHYTNCKGVGHNKKGCTNAHVPPTTHTKQAKNAPSNASNATVSNNASNATVSNNASNAPKRKNPPKGFGIFQCPVTGDTFVKSAGQKRGKWLKNTPSSQRSCTGSNATSVTPRT